MDRFYGSFQKYTLIIFIMKAIARAIYRLPQILKTKTNPYMENYAKLT